MISDKLYEIYTKHPVGQYIINLTVLYPFLAIDQLINTILGGSPAETVSGRLSRAYNPIATFIKKCLEKIDANHCDEWSTKNYPLYEIWKWK